ncbi:MAG: acetyl-CoA carboxylase biotin carboxylase subunit family protein [Candidatus Sericytochromatia bacterium]
MLNVVALSPHFPQNFTHFWLRLREAGARVLGIADTPWEELPSDLRQALTEYYRVEDLHMTDRLEEACRHFIERYGPIQYLESHNEYWLETEAVLRTRLGIPGPNLDTIFQLKRKSQMQRMYEQAGIPVSPGVLATSLETSRELISRTGYPVVAKPDIGVGAAATYKIESLAELQAFWDHKPSVDYFLQGFVKGELHSFDGLVDRDGRVVFCASHVFKQGIMETVNQDLDLSYYSLRNIPAELMEIGQRAVKAFGIRERFFHFEFFRKPDGSWVALEVNMRPPGGWTTDMMNFANDIDVYKGYAELLTKGAFPYAAERTYHCAYAGRKQRDYKFSHAQLLERFGPKLVHHGPMSEVFQRVMGVYGYLVRSRDLEELNQMIETVQATV